jgi:hypothetical protein
MRASPLAIIAAAAFAGQVGAVAGRPQTHEPALASIETEVPTEGAIGEGQIGETRVPDEHPAMANPLWAIPVSKLSATRDRPLFSASRRPRTPVVAAAPAQQRVAVNPPPAPVEPPFSLVGTIIGEDGRFAIFLDQASKTATGIKEGDSVSGWTLRSVDPRSTVVEGSGRTVTLDLPEPAGQDGPAPSVPEAPRRNGLVQGRPSRF